MNIINAAKAESYKLDDSLARINASALPVCVTVVDWSLIIN